MLLTSVFDPEIFSPQSFASSEYYIQILSDYIDKLLRHHILIVDKESIMLKHIRENINKLPPKIASKFTNKINALIQPAYLLRLKPPGKRLEIKELQLLDAESSKIAIDLASYPNDVFVVSRDTKAIIELIKMKQPETYLLKDYSESNACTLENEFSGSVILEGKSIQEVTEKYLNPILYWAKTVTIVDKFINIALCDRKHNWELFRDTVRELYSIWEKGDGFSRSADIGNRFTIISSRCTINADEACNLLENLGLSNKKKYIDIQLKAKSNFKHDRYLITNQIEVNFTKGFDFLNKKNKKCTECTLSSSRKNNHIF